MVDVERAIKSQDHASVCSVYVDTLEHVDIIVIRHRPQVETSLQKVYLSRKRYLMHIFPMLLMFHQGTSTFFH